PLRARDFARRGLRSCARRCHADKGRASSPAARAGRSSRTADPYPDSYRVMRILFVGDIFGKPGREIARRAIPALVRREVLDSVIANDESSAAGVGGTGDVADTILGYGVDAMTSGNHVWDKKEVFDYIDRQPKLLRPANFRPGTPGRGSYVGRTRTGEPIGV